jgi:hypothetical protein
VPFGSVVVVMLSAAGINRIDAPALFVESAMLVAVTATLPVLGTTAGAV